MSLCICALPRLKLKLGHQLSNTSCTSSRSLQLAQHPCRCPVRAWALVALLRETWQGTARRRPSDFVASPQATEGCLGSPPNWKPKAGGANYDDWPPIILHCFRFEAFSPRAPDTSPAAGSTFKSLVSSCARQPRQIFNFLGWAFGCR